MNIKIFKQGFLMKNLLMICMLLMGNIYVFGNCIYASGGRVSCLPFINFDPCEHPSKSLDLQVGPSYFSPITKELNGVQLNKMSGYSLAIDISLRKSRTISSQRLRVEYNGMKDKIFNQKWREYDMGYKFFTKLAGSGDYDFKKGLIIVGIGPGFGISKLENIKKEQVKGNIYYLEGDIIKYFYYNAKEKTLPLCSDTKRNKYISAIAMSIGLRIKWNIGGDIKGFSFSPGLSISVNLP